MSALILLASHTPHLAPLELSLLISQWNSRSHVEADQEISLFQHLSPQSSASSESQSPSHYLLSMDSEFYRITNQYRQDNTLYLRRILGDLGFNLYSICWVYLIIDLINRLLLSLLRLHVKIIVCSVHYGW